IIDKTRPIGAATTADVEQFRLRRFVEALPADELDTHDGRVELADIAAALEGNPRAVLFHAAGPERQPLAGNVAASRSRIARALGVGPGDLLREIQARLKNRPEIVEVSRTQAPAQQVVLTGA